jgi:hypothetical protein
MRYSTSGPSLLSYASCATASEKASKNISQTAVVQLLCTTWGLFRQHWVVAKLGLTIMATISTVGATPSLNFHGQPFA